MTQNVDIFSLQLLLIPVYVTNHWILVTIENLNTERIQINLFDPKYKDRYASIRKEIKEFLEFDHLAKKGSRLWRQVCLSVKTDNVPVQKNDHDCGVFLCQTAKCVSNELILDYDECDMPSLRRQMKKELKHKKVENKLDKRSAEEPLLIYSQLSTKKAMGDKPSFQNRSGDLCWLNLLLQLT